MRDRSQQFIGGTLVDSAAGDVIEVFSARTGEVIGKVAAGSAQDADRAVAAAQAAFPTWAATPVEERARYLRAFAEGIRSRADELVELIAEEIGTIEGTARAMQIGMAAHSFDDAAEHAADVFTEECLGNSVIVQEPVGVIAAITPWNFPLYQAALKIAPALAVGCTAVLKPSEVAGLTALVLADIAAEIGLPAGVLNIVSGEGPVIGEALISNPGIAAVTFTGSDRAGARIAALAGAAVKPVTLELGGKSCHVVLDDSDLEAAVAYSVSSAFGNNGQVCAALGRLIIPVALKERVEEIAVRLAADFRPADPKISGTKLGPVVSEPQRRRLLGIIETAEAEGARLLFGGTEAPELDDASLVGGYFVRPTVFSDVEPHSTLGQEEAFGPVLAIMAFEGDDEEAIRIANGTRYGLNAAVWATDRERAQRVARRLHASTVYINAGKFNPSAPFGGTKGSGFGRERGVYGLYEFVHPKSIQS